MDATAQTAIAALVGWALFAAVQASSVSSFPSLQAAAALSAFVVAETTILFGSIAKALQESVGRAEANRRRKLLTEAMLQVQNQRPLLSATRFDVMMEQHRSDLADAIDAERVVTKSAVALAAALRRFFLVCGAVALTLVVTYAVSSRVRRSGESPTAPSASASSSTSAPFQLPSAQTTPSEGGAVDSAVSVQPTSENSVDKKDAVETCLLDYTRRSDSDRVETVRRKLEQVGFKVSRTLRPSDTGYRGNWPVVSAYYANLPQDLETVLGELLGNGARMHRVSKSSEIPRAVQGMCFDRGAKVAVILPFK